MKNKYIPKWHKELEVFYRIKPVIILEGNISDRFLCPENGYEVVLTDYLNYFLESKGYSNIVEYNGIYGFSPLESSDKAVEKFAELSGAETQIQSGHMAVPFSGEEETAPELISRALIQSAVSCAVIMNMASRYVVSPDHLSQSAVNSFTQLFMAGNTAGEVIDTDGSMLKNLLIILVNKINDLPAWFYHGNPMIKVIHISAPSKEEREEFVDEDGFSLFFDPDVYDSEIDFYNENPEELRKIKDKFVGLTEGMMRVELRDLSRLCENEKFSISCLSNAIDMYRYGIKENPWTSDEMLRRLRSAGSILEQRVKGQRQAVTKTLNVIRRAAAGLSGLQHSSHTRPRGILFFAGPTGTGKTETAKSLAQLLFGDESCCIRFDMSEYSHAHSDQRLLGAPPGYVGYESGGQLTNAVRERPFSILLFDEIEKAHASVLDKFLQILEDGRMTDGQGKTVYFSETVIIFTSNLGIYEIDSTGKRRAVVTAENSYEEVEERIINAVSEYFKVSLGRPEILNRIGENIIVYDFIRRDAAEEILDSQLASIVKDLERGSSVRLVISDEARNTLADSVMTSLENGGRGIGNKVESLLLNPLSCYMIENELTKNAEIVVESIDTTVNPAVITAVGHRSQEKLL